MRTRNRKTLHALGLGLALAAPWPLAAQDGAPERVEGAEPREAGDAEEGDAGTKMPLRLATGDRVRFLASVLHLRARGGEAKKLERERDEPGERATGEDSAAPRMIGYSLTVREAREDGGAVLVLDVEEKTRATRTAPEEEKEEDERSGVLIEVTADGQVISTKAEEPESDYEVESATTDAEPSSPRAAPDGLDGHLRTPLHLRCILGSGLHLAALESGRVYSLAELMAEDGAATAPASDLGLRFEGPSGAKSALFTIVARAAVPTAGAAEIEDDEASAEAADVADGEAGSRPRAAESEDIGQATFRLDDGLLDTLRIDDLAALGVSGVPGEMLMIRRLREVPARPERAVPPTDR